jgi:hypothetical protein
MLVDGLCFNILQSHPNWRNKSCDSCVPNQCTRLIDFNDQNTHIVQDDIVCRDAISCDKKQRLVVDLEDFANLAGSDLLDVVLAEINLGDSCSYRHAV